MTSGHPQPHSFSFLGCFKRTFRPEQLMAPPEVQKTFRTYAENDVMSATKLKEFLQAVQGETDVTLEETQKILDQRLAQEKHPPGKERHDWTLDSFFQFLLDPKLNPACNDKLHHDMNLPASHYFIYTGHNSYLTGNQLSSDCSVVPIVDALRRGVRVVELDLWPSKEKNEIHVLHGGTMTSPVSFEKCIIAIRDNAFVASPYPVVITFEDHLTTELQAQAAEITSRVLGKLLKIPDEDEKFTEFPSPESIKGRILISTKPPSEYKKGKKNQINKGEVVLQAVGKVEGAAEKVGLKKGKPKKEQSLGGATFDWGDEVPSFHGTIERADSKSLTEDEAEEDSGDGQMEHVPHPDYKKIIAIRAGKPKGSLVDSLAVDEVVRRVSLSEPQLEKVAQKNPMALISFTERNLLRIYPYGLRFDSSNYNPLIAWSHGAQMVAFNMQGYGRPLWLVHGFFTANGGCGYVKKPDCLFPSATGVKFDPQQELSPKMTLKVKVIMGLGWLEKFGKHYFDSYSPPDFYTKIGIAGLPADTISQKTDVIKDEWIPKWEHDFKFSIRLPELALLRIEVHEYDMTDTDDFGGQIVLPVSELKRGFRSVTLLDKKGHPLDGVRLLLKFEIILNS